MAARLCCCNEPSDAALRPAPLAHVFLADLDVDALHRMSIAPAFVPPVRGVLRVALFARLTAAQSHGNHDPIYELEEMILETNPLYKKSHRVRSGSRSSMNVSEAGGATQRHSTEAAAGVEASSVSLDTDVWLRFEPYDMDMVAGR